MRVLLDNMVDVRLCEVLKPVDATHVRDRGWSSLKNGNLINAASQDFDVLLTFDKGIPHQNNLRTANICVVVVRSTNLSLNNLEKHRDQIIEAIKDSRPGTHRQIQIDD